MATKGVSFFLTITSLMHNFSAREIPFPGLHNLIHPRIPDLEIHAMDCWTALYKIRSCSNETVAYFSNGAIDITPSCCQAITVITHNCWAAVLSVLGYGLDQANITRGYCDAVASEVVGFRPVPSLFGQPSQGF
ncbi:hypothetical protein CDL12_00344 [Handroanthus impetiginosus]|uniref:Prolamin-like domain-containing protein n=1 Tax=Handroanthus impetiginosus TaxID=429701 RepID=A0A2G9IAW6_9LAMI|nr:hypothetical protein CDL12_00344 [Handroanthus impetiginosus]